MSLIVKKGVKSHASTTIAIKTTEEFKNKWDEWAVKNKINKKATLEIILTKIMNGELK